MLTSIRNAKFYKTAVEYKVYHRCLCYFLKEDTELGGIELQRSSTFFKVGERGG